MQQCPTCHGEGEVCVGCGESMNYCLCATEGSYYDPDTCPRCQGDGEVE